MTDEERIYYSLRAEQLATLSDISERLSRIALDMLVELPITAGFLAGATELVRKAVRNLRGDTQQ